MAQNYTINSYQADHVGQSDLQNMENNFECLRSSFSGTSSPANAVTGKQWFDTTQKLFKIRNDANDAWLGVMCGDVDQKMIVYRNTAMDGWAIDSGVEDKVIGLKGGSVYTTGGATAGSWASSSHTLVEAETPTHNHGSDSHNHDYSYISFTYGTSYQKDGSYGTGAMHPGGGNGLTGTDAMNNDSHTHANFGSDGGHIHAADANVRPTAAVCTLQYLDI